MEVSVCKCLVATELLEVLKSKIAPGLSHYQGLDPSKIVQFDSHVSTLTPRFFEQILFLLKKGPI